MSIASIIGYLLLFGLALAFCYVGFKGFSATGLQVTRHFQLKGRMTSQVVGSVLILLGASIFMAGAWDLVGQVMPQKKDEPIALPPAPQPEADDKKQPEEQPKIRPVGSDGIYLDVKDKWTRKFGVRGGWFRREQSGLVTFGTHQEPIIVTGFSIIWTSEGWKDLPEPNAPFGLTVTASESDAALKEIRRFKELQLLNLSLTKLSNQGLENLRDLPRLEWLLLFSAKSTNGDFSAIGGCKKLTYLSLGSTNVSDSSLKEIGQLDGLEELMLFNTPVTDTGVQNLGKLSKLKVLSLEFTKTSDAGLKALSELKQLRKLGLNGTSITDAGLKHLTELDQLEDLNLVLTKITDKGLRELASLKRLRTLHLLATRVTDEGVAELKKSNPRLEIGIR